MNYALDDPVVRALGAIELVEMTLLSRGVVDSALTRDELRAIVTRTVDPATEEAVVLSLLRGGLVLERAGQYRSRMAETVRLMVRLRQSFRGQAVTDGTPLTADYRLVHKSRRRPKLDRSIDDLFDRLPNLSENQRSVVQAVSPGTQLRAFQVRGTERIMTALTDNEERAIVIAAGTGSGKTAAFYLPALMSVTEWIRDDGEPWAKVLALYPRNELLKDQFNEVVKLVSRLSRQGVTSRRIRIGAWFSETPSVPGYLTKSWKQHGGKGDSHVFPLAVCPEPGCGGDLLWPKRLREQGVEILNCATCGYATPDGMLALTRKSLQKEPADIIFSTTESLNRQLGDSDSHAVFGLSGAKRLRLALLDEIHTYEGITGAQNAYLMRRLRHMSARNIVWCGLSATLTNGRDFVAQFFGLGLGQIDLVEPTSSEIDFVGGEYLLALRHDSTQLTSALSLTIQAIMLLSRSLDCRPPEIGRQPISSGGLFGEKCFVFTDKLDVTNRLFWSTMDAEGWKDEGRLATGARYPFSTLAHMRSIGQDRVMAHHREDTEARDADGEVWWMAEELGHGVDADTPKRIQLVSSQAAGHVDKADIVIATSTLEVGYSDDRVGAVVQHKAPRTAAQYLQRKGRAGRRIEMRPWTIATLSGWGRDRLAWQMYDQFLDPEVSPRSLPLRNRYVLRVQALYATLDWLAVRLAGLGLSPRSSWADLAGPAESLHQDSQGVPKDNQVRARKGRQNGAARLLEAVIKRDLDYGDWKRYVTKALAISDAELDFLCFASPRPLLLAAIPTMHRRLSTQWEGERPGLDDDNVKFRNPVPDFLPKSLFADLISAEVTIVRPARQWNAEDGEIFESLPVARVLREFLPGNVTRHFGSKDSVRHWVPIPATLPVAEQRYAVDVSSTYAAVSVGFIEHAELGRVPMLTPTRVAIEPVGADFLDSTTTIPEWEVELEAVGAGRPLELPPRLTQSLVRSASSHLHNDGNAVRIRRYVLEGRGRTRSSNGRGAAFHAVSFTADGAPVALGFEYETDGVCFSLVSAPIGALTANERRDAAKDLLRDDEGLPDAVSSFDRERLATLLDATITRASLVENLTHDVILALTEDELLAKVETVTELGLSTSGGEVAVEEGPDESYGFLGEDGVGAALKRATRVLLGDSPDWSQQWRQRRLASTFGASLIEAVLRLSPDVDADDLSVDVSFTGDSVWIAELSSGGNGHIELLVEAIAKSGLAFAQIVRSQTEPGEIEVLGEEIALAVETIAAIPEIRARASELLAAWTGGHKRVEEALDGLTSSLSVHGIAARQTLVSALSSRLFAPGEQIGTVDIAALVNGWCESARMQLGYHPDHGVLVGVASEALSVELIRYRPDLVDPKQRRRFLEIITWPRQRSAAQHDLAPVGMFKRLPETDRTLLADVLGPDAPEIEVGESEKIRQALIDRAEVLVAVPASSPDADRITRQLIIESQATPIDVEGLLIYPRVAGVVESGGRYVVRLVIEEGSQWRA